MYNYLPKSNSIDTQRLGRLFDDKAESYKLFWFQAIVQKVYEGKLSLSFDTLINEMIADADKYGFGKCCLMSMDYDLDTDLKFFRMH